MKKTFFAFVIMLLVCSVGYAESLHHFIEGYRKQEGVKYMVFNRNSKLNSVPKNAFSPFSLKMRSGTLKVLGIEKMMVLQLHLCEEEICEMFTDEACHAVPVDFSQVNDTEKYQVFVNNSEEKGAQILILNYKTPGLSLLYVTNAFFRAIISDSGDELDMDKLQDYLDQYFEKIQEKVSSLGDFFSEYIY